MLVMKNIFFFNMSKFYKIKKLKSNNFKKTLFTLIKNYYLVLKNHKNLILFNAQDNIYMYFTTLSSVNLLCNKKMDKWFIYKLISNID